VGRFLRAKAALRYLTKAIKRNGKPSLVNIDKIGAMIKKGQVKKDISRQPSCADQFYALVA